MEVHNMKKYIVHIYPSMRIAQQHFQETLDADRETVEKFSMSSLSIEYEYYIHKFMSENRFPENIQGLTIFSFSVDLRCKKYSEISEFLLSIVRT